MTEHLPAGESFPVLAQARHTPRRRTYKKLKPRSDSVIDYLPDDQHRQLCIWLRTAGMSMEKIVTRLREDYGVKVSEGSISRFYQKYMAEQMIERRRRAMDSADKVNEDIDLKPGKFARASVDTALRRVWERINAEDLTLKEMEIYLTLIVRIQDQEIKKANIDLKHRRLDMIEKKAAEAEKTANDSKLTPAQKAERIAHIFKRFPNNEVTPRQTTTIKKNGHRNGIAA